MSRLIFAALGSIGLAGPCAAQQVPGRDLFQFPLGLLAEPAALSSQMTGGLWNPASAELAGTDRAAVGIAGLYSPQDQGVRLTMIGGAYRVRPSLTATASMASAWVTDILRTETDPQSLGGEIPYGSTVLSAGLATGRHNVTLGVSARYRSGAADAERAGAFGVDAGAIVDRVAGTPVRVAASTFLFSPTNTRDGPSYLVGADVPVFTDSTAAMRAGYGITFNDSRGREEYAFSTGRYRQLDLSAGVARTVAFGNRDLRWRLGCGLRYASYTLAIGREDGAAGLGASYQFLFKRVIP